MGEQGPCTGVSSAECLCSHALMLTLAVSGLLCSLISLIKPMGQLCVHRRVCTGVCAQAGAQLRHISCPQGAQRVAESWLRRDRGWRYQWVLVSKRSELNSQFCFLLPVRTHPS